MTATANSSAPWEFAPKWIPSVDDLAVDDGEDRADLLDLRVGHGEVVPVQHDQIGQLAGFDRADLVLHPQEPAVAAREQAERLLARDLLVAVDPVAERVDAGRREVDVQPRIERRDVDAVAVDAGLDAVIDDRPERRADDDLRVGRRDPAERAPSARRSRAPGAA